MKLLNTLASRILALFIFSSLLFSCQDDEDVVKEAAPKLGKKFTLAIVGIEGTELQETYEGYAVFNHNQDASITYLDIKAEGTGKDLLTSRLFLELPANTGRFVIETEGSEVLGLINFGGNAFTPQFSKMDVDARAERLVIDMNTTATAYDSSKDVFVNIQIEGIIEAVKAEDSRVLDAML